MLQRQNCRCGMKRGSVGELSLPSSVSSTSIESIEDQSEPLGESALPWTIGAAKCCERPGFRRSAPSLVAVNLRVMTAFPDNHCRLSLLESAATTAPIGTERESGATIG